MDELTQGQDVVRIETPEHVVFEYELAGLASRIMAAVIDLIIVGLVMLGLFGVVALAVGGLEQFGPWALAFGMLAAFLVIWGYPVFFELLWRGQTPGKRSLRLRVIQEGGYALTPQVVIVRNLLRIVDFLPGGFFVGVLVMMLNRRYKRVGDFVAGTLVIREGAAASPPARWELSVPAGLEERVAELRRSGVHRIDAAQLQLIREFMRRRATPQPEARLQLAGRLAESVGAVLGASAERPELFLQCVLVASQQGEPKEPPQ